MNKNKNSINNHSYIMPNTVYIPKAATSQRRTLTCRALEGRDLDRKELNY
jgi:hypothetical protein